MKEREEWERYRKLFPFPPVEQGEDIVAMGGGLSLGRLLSAYSQGIFPWYAEGEPIIWWSPDPRCLLTPSEVHVSRSMKREIARGGICLTLDTDFSRVVACCGSVRGRLDGTWITKAMREAYGELHRRGYAHSVEVRSQGELVGGLYGVSLGAAFFGESMFSLKTNASKWALIALSCHLKQKGFLLIDCQQTTPHLVSMGAREVSRTFFLSLLKKSLENRTVKEDWSALCPGFSSSLFEEEEGRVSRRKVVF